MTILHLLMHIPHMWDGGFICGVAFMLWVDKVILHGLSNFLHRFL